MFAATIDMFPLRFFRFQNKLDANALFGTFTQRKNRYDINARVTSATDLLQQTVQMQPLATCVMSC